MTGFFFEILWKEKNVARIKNQMEPQPRVEGFDRMGIDQKIITTNI